MANRSARPKTKSRRVPIGAWQSGTNTAGLTGRDCSHGDCKRVRTLVTVRILRDGPGCGFSQAQCRQALALLQFLLCVPVNRTPKNQPKDLLALLYACFINACIETDATNLLGQTMPWYAPMREAILAMPHEDETIAEATQS